MATDPPNRDQDIERIIGALSEAGVRVLRVEDAAEKIRPVTLDGEVVQPPNHSVEAETAAEAKAGQGPRSRRQAVNRPTAYDGET